MKAAQFTASLKSRQTSALSSTAERGATATAPQARAAVSARGVGSGAHTQDGPGPRVTCAAALARFRVRSPQRRRRRATGWRSVRFPDPSLWCRRDQTPEDCGCSGQSLTGRRGWLVPTRGEEGTGTRTPGRRPAALRQVCVALGCCSTAPLPEGWEQRTAL